MKPDIPNHDLLPGFIELETSTRCNRACPWCPNSLYDRGKKQEYMPQSLFDKIINDLAELSYSGELALHNYNEPLLDEHIFDHIRTIREKLSSACLTLFTNGDYLDRSVLERLQTEGVQTLIISMHDALGKPDFHDRIRRLKQKLNLEEECIDTSDPLGIKITTIYKGMRIIYYIPYPSMLTSRGGIVEKYNASERGDGSCFLPFSACAIDVEGNVKICCEVYPASQIHREHGIIGNLQTKSFAELWFSEAFNAFRRSILARINENVICSSCPGYGFVNSEERMKGWEEYLKC